MAAAHLEHAPDPLAEAREARVRAEATVGRAAAAAARVRQRYVLARRTQLKAIALQWGTRRRQFDRFGAVVCMAVDPSGLLDLDIRHAHDGSVVEVRAAGEIDISSSPALGACLSQLLGRGCPVVIDLSGITFMDASGARALLDAQSLATAAATTLALRQPSRAVTRVLELTGEVEHLPIEPPAKGVA